MKLIPLSKIVIKPNRQRIEFEPEALQSLVDSIEKIGLLHMPVLRREGDTFVLVAGERRLRAMTQIFELGGKFTCGGLTIPEGQIPYTDIGELSELEAEEAELDENIKRRDLTWQEHAAAVKRLHELRQKQKDQKANKVLDFTEADLDVAESYVQTVADTAEEIHGRSDGWYGEQTRKEIIVARHLDNPAIAKAKNADEAFKILKKEEEKNKNIALAHEVGKTFSSTMHRVFNMDCLSFMTLAENQGKYDVILTDPPYGMGADSFGDGGGKLQGIEHHYDDSYESWFALMKQWVKLSFSVTKPQAHAYVFCDIDNFPVLRDLMREAGWYVFRTPFIVHKINSGRVPLPTMGPRRQYETLLYAIKGDKSVTHIYPDVIPCTADDNMTHGAQKPVELFQNLLQRSVRAGDEVLDTFSGTGTLIPAAHALMCKATVVELNPEYYALNLKRLRDLDNQESLF